MHLNMAHKIFGIALVVLVLMAAVAVYSVRLTAEISADLDLMATKQLPLSDTIGELNVKILEQGVLMQRLFALPEESTQMVARVEVLGSEIDADFKRAYALLKAEAESRHPPETIDALGASMAKVERAYRVYEKRGLDLLALHRSGDRPEFHEKLPDFNKLQSSVDAETGTLRRHVEAVADEAIKRADENERFLLMFNTVMTALSAVLALGIAALVTSVLVRNVRNLVRAAEQVEDGVLDVEVEVTTNDEVGRLSASFNDMVGGLRQKERIKDTFGRYIDPRIVDKLLEDEQFTQFGGERREMTVMFIDLQGYTSISEQLAPHDLVRMLNMFLGHMTDAVAATQGVINDFQGDAVMAYWGPPFTGADEHAALACQAALGAQANFETFRADVAAELGTSAEGLDLGMRIGISTGHMIAGNIGSPTSRKFSVVGDPVNLGARLEGANKTYGTRAMLSERTRELAGDTVHVRELDLIRVKGKTEPTRIFELLTPEASVNDLVIGLQAYRARDWPAAELAFQALKDAAPTDPVPPVFLDRIAHLKQNPPEAGWDGVWVFETK